MNFKEWCKTFKEPLKSVMKYIGHSCNLDKRLGELLKL